MCLGLAVLAEKGNVTNIVRLAKLSNWPLVSKSKYTPFDTLGVLITDQVPNNPGQQKSGFS